MSQVRAIEHVIFKTGFSLDRFSPMVTSVVKKRIAKDLIRKNNMNNNQGEIAPESSIITLALATPALSPLAQPLPTRLPVVSVLHEALRGKTISQALQLGTKKQIYDLISLLPRLLNQLFCKIQNNDKIALAIGTFPLLHCQPNSEYRLFAKSFDVGWHCILTYILFAPFLITNG